MSEPATPDQLTHIVTDWEKILVARKGGDTDARLARNELAERYYAAIRRRLLGKLRNQADVADAIASDVILGFLEGGGVLRRAGDRAGCMDKPGSFRSYLRAALNSKIKDHFRRLGGAADPLPASDDIDAFGTAPAGDDGDDEEIGDALRAELRERVMRALEARGATRDTVRDYYHLLRLQQEHQREHPDSPLGSARLAELLEPITGRALKPAHVNQLLHRAREMYAELLVGEVAASLRLDPAARVPAQLVQDELINLRLLNVYVKKALEQYAGSA